MCMKDTKVLAERIEVIPRSKIEDKRGWFLKIITGHEKKLPNYTGEVYSVWSENGSSRGGHYHLKATEWFTLIQGKSELELFDIKTNEKLTILLDSMNPQTIVVPTGIAHIFHAIDNQPFLLLAYTDMLYSPQDTVPVNFK